MIWSITISYKIKMNSSVFNNLCERWEDDYIANKNMLAFGEYDFDYDDYADLIKQSYNYLNEVIKLYNLSTNDLHNSNSAFLFDYAKLVSLIKSYATTENFQEYSEEYISSMLIAKKLTEMCCNPQAEFNGTLIFRQGFDSENNIVYDIEKGDFSKISDHGYDFIEYLMY